MGAELRKDIRDLERFRDSGVDELVLRQAGDVLAFKYDLPFGWAARSRNDVEEKLLFPAPFGPMMEVNSPDRKATETSPSATNFPYRSVTFSALRTMFAVIGRSLRGPIPIRLWERT